MSTVRPIEGTSGRVVFNHEENQFELKPHLERSVNIYDKQENRITRDEFLRVLKENYSVEVSSYANFRKDSNLSPEDFNRILDEVQKARVQTSSSSGSIDGSKER